ncbi:sigma 54-interacting transcriptional regulator [Candidatus Manganitrophus noduliformans]|uniref:GAF domain-containing protein n=1 Tax=Candidatus Manganitrophus noduliformans TaxID=2606439 RepID=A0A7X6DSG9_9BACT|nr:sigma 54-interacting transcriptional regulator [Candidatus Manganitrophus noduliformans]NKE72509.1 GAF domain-containing protein [Candidatus Manganitrophus noduliformans]
MSNASEQTPDQQVGRYRSLLEVTEAIALHRDLHELFRDLAHRLPQVVSVHFVGLSLYNAERNTIRLHTLQANVPAEIIGGHESSLENSPAGFVWKQQDALIVHDVNEEDRWPETVRRMKEDGINSFCVVPLTTPVGRLGAIIFSSLKKAAYDGCDLEFLKQVGKQVALAVENALNFQNAQSYQKQLTHERDRQRLLLEINNALVSHLNLQDLLKAFSAHLRQVIPHDYAGLSIYDPHQGRLIRHALDFPQDQDILKAGFQIPLDSPTGRAFASGKTMLFPTIDLVALPEEYRKRMIAIGVKSGCSVPLISHGRVLGTLDVASLREKAFSEEDAELLTQVAGQIAIAVENALAYQQIEALKNKLAKEKLYLEEEIRATGHNFEEIVGESAVLKRILQQVETVAPTDSTVLIQGETGTGKELIARAIHNLSGRHERTFVKMNCAAIPTGLLESELFGHERGAFTGAIAQKIGRFELAHQGTLFLDEVGDIPLELQSKLLRVLQEQEFERLGSNRTIKVNVRLIAATNQDLLRMVAEKQFRSDLYYRLNVFPVSLPSLRERSEDIPQLVRYFTQKYARQMNKQIETIPSEAMAALSKYPWPGNIRELENLIERSVILSQGTELRVPLGELKGSAAASSDGNATLEAAERKHILRVLQETNWVIGGPSGAATRLGMKRTTLQSKIQKLGITRPS